jgi:hypothetical protein
LPGSYTTSPLSCHLHNVPKIRGASVQQIYGETHTVLLHLKMVPTHIEAEGVVVIELRYVGYELRWVKLDSEQKTKHLSGISQRLSPAEVFVILE